MEDFQLSLQQEKTQGAGLYVQFLETPVSHTRAPVVQLNQFLPLNEDEQSLNER